MIAGLVLAGGRSRRFGSEKAMALFNGELLLKRAVVRLTVEGFAVAINAPKGSGAATWAAEHGLLLLTDDAADPAGPLAGVKAGLLWAKNAGAELLATTPCDTPRLAVDLEQTLIAALAPQDGAATARSPSGLQSLCTVWRVERTLQVLGAHFAHGAHPAVHDLLAELDGVDVAFSDDRLFINLNTLEDMAAASSL